MTISLHTINPGVGVEIRGISGDAIDSHDALEKIRDATHHHACALLRELEIEPERLSGLAHGLGVPLPPYRPQYSLLEWPEIVQIGNIRVNGEVAAYLNRGGIEWHTDSPGSSHSPGYTLIYCLESDIPDGGGETGFASTVTGYAILPEALKDKIVDLKLVQSFNTFNDQVANYDYSTVPAQAGDLRARNQGAIS